MRKKLLALIALYFACMQILNAQGTYVVNNTPGAPASYHNLQNALNNVPAGSIILLQNSGLNYGGAVLTKPVVIYGSGYFLGQNTGANTQANLAETLVDHITFQTGCQGSIISGIRLKDSINYQHPTRFGFGSVSNITISRCLIDNAAESGTVSSFAGTCSSITIDHCFFLMPAGGALAGEGFNTSVTNFLIANNIVTGSFDFFDNSPPGMITSMVNNTFYGSIPGNFHASKCQLFRNNIVIITDTIQHPEPVYYFGGSPDAFGNADHNLTNAPLLFKYDAAANSTNVINPRLNIDSVFINYSNNAITSMDGVWQLKAGSKAKGLGGDGKDAGAFGGSAPYVLSGIPAIPNIYFADVSQTGATTGGLKVHLKIKANN